jgi:hypothetical protein
MSVERLRRGRRLLTATVVLSAMLALLARVTGPDTDPAAKLAARAGSVLFALSSISLLVVWRREHVAAEEEFRAREMQTLVMLRLQAELARRKRDDAAEPEERDR